MSNSTVAKNRKKSSSRKKKNSATSRAKTVRLCQKHMESKVVKIEYPGGKSRESCRMKLENGQSVIATRRSKPFRAELEVRTLRSLNKHGAPVPRLIATDGHCTLIQEEIFGQRLSQELKDADPFLTEKLLDSALDGLAKAQKAAEVEQLHERVPALGTSQKWIDGLINRPIVFGKFFDLPAPELDYPALREMLKVENPHFVKWDARPGNALVDQNGRVFWFDWEHAGVRNSLDDMAWLLCDEFVPNYPAVEEKLINKYLPQFSTDDEAVALEYLHTFGTFHMLVRLGLILKYKADKEWWDEDYCISRDKIGITQNCARRTCDRAARWAGSSDLTRPLEDWILKLAEKLEL